MEQQLIKSNTTIYNDAPLSILSNSKKDTLTDRYSFINSKEICEYIENQGLSLQATSFANTRKVENEGKQKHCMIFNTGYFIDKDNEVTLIVTNSYNGRTCLQFNLGIYRTICANGLVVGDDFAVWKSKHVAINQDYINEVLTTMLDTVPLITDKVTQLQNLFIDFTAPQSRQFIENSCKFAYGDKKDFVIDYIRPERIEDKEPSLYNLLNVTQEHIINGNVHHLDYDNDNQKRLKKVRKLSDIEKVRKVNQYMFNEVLQLAA